MDLDDLRRVTRRHIERGPEFNGICPRLVHTRIRQPQAVALLLHGGEVDGLDRQRTWGLPTLPMIPLAERIERWSHKRIAALRLINSVQGWNEPIRSPLADAEWALMRLRQLYPDLPIALVGHSMGGRTAFSLAADDRVTSVVGLAPWLSDAFHERDFANTPLFVVHGRQDTVTDDETSADLVERVKAAGGDATYLPVTGWHDLLWQARDWQRPVEAFLERTLLKD